MLPPSLASAAAPVARAAMSALLLVTLSIPTAQAAQPVPSLAPREGDAGLVHGRDHAFLITAPRGWILDNTLGESTGIHAMLYRVGETYRSAQAKAVMYANAQATAPEVGLEAFIDKELAEFGGDSPDLTVQELPGIALANRREATVRKLTNDVYRRTEAIAYIREPRSVVMIVLNAASPAEFTRAYPDYVRFVQSYQYLGENFEVIER